jgi:tetratricopeptide (TPR) repeat protein
MAMSSTNNDAQQPSSAASGSVMPSNNSTTISDAKPAPEPSQQQASDAAPLDYLGSINSPTYQYGWSCLQSGAFDDALEAAELGLTTTKERLVQAFQARGDVLSEEELDLHEALAPFHYLYGTTLLYSVEEQSSEQLTASMTSMESPAEASSDNGDDEYALENNGEQQLKQEFADDLEIAWDNLEVARAVLEKMIHGKTVVPKEKMQLDLAQICLRAADLQRMNGRYEDAIIDFEKALQLRTETSLLGPFDRKIADVHMNLGGTYLLLVAETKKSQADEPTINADELEKKLMLWRSRGFYHSFMAGKTLCGQIAIMCNVEPTEFFQQAEQDIPSFKSTGLEEHEELIDHPTTLSLKLKSLRKHASSLQPMNGQEEQFADLNDWLDEIQESIDEGEAGEEGVQKVQQMKAEITAAVANQQEAEDAAAGGGVVTTTIGFGSAAAVASTATAQPISTMMVKKKKKREGEEHDDMDSKPAAKQLKSAE